MEDLVGQWRGRRVFITGHTGFKGSWLALWLTHLGASVRGYALDPGTDPNMFTVTRLNGALDDVRGDILDRSKLEAAMSQFFPEVVFHLAAQPLVRRSYSDPLGTYMTNVMGTAHVLEAVRHTTSVRAVLCVTTDKCYENREWVWPYRETDRLGGYDPYSSSKACAELVSAAYRNSFFPVGQIHQHGVALATARAGNVIGGGDWSEDRLVPDLIRGFRSCTPVHIRRPKSIRPWQHVLEPLYGYISLAQRLLARDARCELPAFNFGPTDVETWTVEQIANRLAERWGKNAAWICDPDPGAHEAGVLRLDSSRARAELNWKPKLSTEDALEWTIEWFQAWDQGAYMKEFTLEQIKRYELATA